LKREENWMLNQLWKHAKWVEVEPAEESMSLPVGAAQKGEATIRSRKHRCCWNGREMMLSDDLVISFVLLFVTKVLLKKESMSMAVGTAKAGNEDKLEA
jgi:hypothetical protein